MEIVLDTNIFYDYFGREQLGEIPRNIVNHKRLNLILNSNKNTVIITSITIIEFINRYKENPNVIKSMIDFIDKKEISFIDSGIHNFSEDELLEIKNSKNSSMIFFHKKYLKKKINAEVGVAITFCVLFLELYLDLFFKREEKANNRFRNLNDVKKEELKYFVHKSLISDGLNLIISRGEKNLRKQIKLGYATDCVKKKAKDAYNDFLQKNLLIISVLARIMTDNYLEGLKEIEISKLINNAIETNFDSIEISKNKYHVTKAISKIKKEFQSIYNIDYIGENYKKNLSKVDKNIKFTDNQIKYILELQEGWIENRKKLEKNDITDFLILGAIKNRKFLTLDNQLRNFIKKTDIDSEELILKISEF